MIVPVYVPAVWFGESTNEIVEGHTTVLTPEPANAPAVMGEPSVTAGVGVNVPASAGVTEDAAPAR